MTAKKIRTKFLNFFKSQNHNFISPAPIIPENDPTTLFTSSGMQQLVPFLKGAKHPMGACLANSQPCFRAEDIYEIGDNRHTTFFEMLGNWSLGNYFKSQQLSWFFTFLTQELEIDPDRLYVTVFVGDKNIKKDKDSIAIWQELFKTSNPAQDGETNFNSDCHIYTYPAKKNWWSRSGIPANMPVGEIGGPDSEVFYDFDPQNKLKFHQNSKFKNQPCHVNCDCGRFLEIGNSVFIQFEKTKNGFKPLPQKNVDFGGGLERLECAANNEPDIFKTSLLTPIISQLKTLINRKYEDNKESFRVIADHLRASVFMISQALEPSNKTQGYILRRLIRRSLLKLNTLTEDKITDFSSIVNIIAKNYEDTYPQIEDIKNQISESLTKEVKRFQSTLTRGLKEFDKISNQILTAEQAFKLYESYGFPFELSLEQAQEKKIKIEEKIKDKFQQFQKAHAKKSRTAAKVMFAGGLAGNDEIITRYHTATHLLHESLRRVLGNSVSQAGSNITAERLRFDITHPAKLTQEEIKKVEDLINQQICKNLSVNVETMTLENAQKQGALAFFTDKYEQKVKVYSIGNFSKEVCGGPHVSSIGNIGKFKIGKQKNIGQGKIRIYGYLE